MQIPSKTKKNGARLGLVQWKIRQPENFSLLLSRAEKYVANLAMQGTDFVLFPEYFTTSLISKNGQHTEREAIRDLAFLASEVAEQFSLMAKKYATNIITGSLPRLQNDRVYNVGFLCRRDGSIEEYEKLHVTPDESSLWGICAGDKKVHVFETDCATIGILICYDVEFPELSRFLSSDGMEILFVPFLTSSIPGYFRVRHCAQARAIENECYVAMAGCVGSYAYNQTKDTYHAQSAVLSPCDVTFPASGVINEGVMDAEMTLIADVSFTALQQLHHAGTVRNLNQRRLDLYACQWIG